MSDQKTVLITTASPAPNRLQTFNRVSKALPLNEFGLPRYLYRSDLIPADLDTFSLEDKRDTLTAAVVPITYREGYPTFVDGTPLWKRADYLCESAEDFAYFDAYLNQLKEYGYRQIAELESEPIAEGTTRSHLESLFTFNYWAVRAKAFDLFQVACHRKMREQRLMSIENLHFLESERLLDTIRAKSEVIFSADKLEAVEPLDAVRMMQLLVNIQRQALGVGGQNGSRNKTQEANEPPPNASLEVTMRTIAQNSGGVQDKTKVGNSGETPQNLRILLGDPQTAGMAQELIVRMHLGQKQLVPEIEPAYEDGLTGSRKIPSATTHPASVAPAGPIDNDVIDGDAIDVGDDDGDGGIDDTDRAMLG